MVRFELKMRFFADAQNDTIPSVLQSENTVTYDAVILNKVKDFFYPVDKLRNFYMYLWSKKNFFMFFKIIVVNNTHNVV